MSVKNYIEEQDNIKQEKEITQMGDVMVPLDSSWIDWMTYQQQEQGKNKFFATIYFDPVKTMSQSNPFGFGPNVFVNVMKGAINRMEHSGSPGTRYWDEWIASGQQMWGGGQTTSNNNESTGGTKGQSIQEVKKDLQDYYKDEGYTKAEYDAIEQGDMEVYKRIERQLKKKREIEEYLLNQEVIDASIKQQGKFQFWNSMKDYSSTFRSYTGITIPRRVLYASFTSLDIPITPQNWNKIRFHYKNVAILLSKQKTLMVKGIPTNVSVSLSARLKQVAVRMGRMYNPLYMTKQAFHRINGIVRQAKKVGKSISSGKVLAQVGQIMNGVLRGATRGFAIGKAAGLGIPILSTITGLVGATIGGTIGIATATAGIFRQVMTFSLKALLKSVGFGPVRHSKSKKLREEEIKFLKNSDHYQGDEREKMIKERENQIKGYNKNKRATITRRTIRNTRSLGRKL